MEHLMGKVRKREEESIITDECASLGPGNPRLEERVDSPISTSTDENQPWKLDGR
jgi:hypothetical protein